MPIPGRVTKIWTPSPSWKSVAAKVLDDKGAWTPFLVVETFRGVHVHRATSGPILQQGWRVTLSASGLLVTVLRSEGDAKRVAEDVVRLLPAELAGRDREEVLSSLPPWVEDWCRRLREVGTYSPPTK